MRIELDERYVYLIPSDEAEGKRLELEAWIVTRLGQAGCKVPAVVRSDRGMQVRTKILGVTLYESEKVALGPKGEVLARDIGEAFAICHGAFAGEEAELETKGLRRFRYDAAALLRNVRAELDDRQTKRLETVAARYEQRGGDVVFCHGDLSHHNLCSDPETGHLQGLFDFGDSCLGVRELDFKFMRSNGPRFFETCVKRYEELTSVALDRCSINDHHILEAADNLIYALAHPKHGIERCRAWLKDVLA